MILILLSWVYILFTTLLFGITFSKVLRIKQFDFVVTTILGLFSITLFATVWAFFGPINMLFHSVLLLLSILFFYWYKTNFTLIIHSVKTQIVSFPLPIKVLLAISCVLALAQSATLPFIIDNESYYIQTIKWLNEYGFVKGLANLHLFLGQTSGWHITQSVYSFSFLYNRFNDLNGFCLLLANFFAFQKLHTYFIKSNRLDLTFGLLPLSYVFLFQFVSSPSPDLAVYIFGFVVLSIFLENAVVPTKDGFLLLTVIVLFAVFIKITAVIFLLFPIFLLLKHYKVLKENLCIISCLGTFILILFVLKNTILTGYPIFPLAYFRMNGFDYTIPSVIMDYFFSKNMMNSFYIPYKAYDVASRLDIIKYYFLYNGISSCVGIATLATLILTPFVFCKNRVPSSLWVIYFAFICLIFLLCFSSPQYRFYINFTLFFWLLLLSYFFTNRSWIIGLCGLSFTFVVIVIFVPLTFVNLSTNSFQARNCTFHLINIVIPEPNTRWKPEYKVTSVGNMSYHSAVDISFFWVTGNGQLPCVNDQQIKYFEQGFFYIPQQRSTDLGDGFYAQKVSGHE